MNNPIYLNYEDGASAFLFDLRNSTRLVRFLSYQTDNEGYSESLVYYSTFVTSLKLKIHDFISKEKITKTFAVNDTGDGYLCVFWNTNHTVTCLKVALNFYKFLSSELELYNKILMKRFSYQEGLTFGLGMHCGGCVIYKSRKKYIYGIAVNTAARLESQTKDPKRPKILVSGNFYKFLKQQLPKQKLHLMSHLKLIDKNRIPINDKKEAGHFCYKIAFKDKLLGQLMG